MTLVSNLNPNSVPGCYTGTLFMNISSQTDWLGAHPWWKAGAAYASGLEQKYTMSGLEVSLNLVVGNDSGTKGRLRIMGQMSVTVNGAVIADTMRFGEGGDIFIPSITGPKSSQMFGNYEKNGARLGFWLPVPWDGQGAVCRGLWWAMWPK